MNGGRGSFRRRLAAALSVVLFAVPALLCLAMPVTGPKKISDLENRPLAQFPAWSVSAFLDGTFQDQLDDALADQYPGADQIKSLTLDARNTIQHSASAAVAALLPSAASGYTAIAEGYYHYRGDERRIVERPLDVSDRREHLERLAALYRDIPGADLYIYFIENSRTVDFDHPGSPDPYYQAVLDAFQPDGADVFSVPDYDAYCRLFYQTDHHWNAAGAYEGYRAVYALLHPDTSAEGLIPPGEAYETSVSFQGSYARQTHLLCADEPFICQTYPLPEHTILIEGRKAAYGHAAQYARGRYPTDPLRNHYAYCYGGDYGLIQYDFEERGRGSLLLVASSYSNPINALIAADYDHTWVVDPRYYEAWAGEPFDPRAFCAEHGVGTVLLLGDVRFFYTDEAESEDPS